MSKNIESRPSKRETPEELKELEQDLKSLNPKIFNGLSKDKKQELLHSFALTVYKSHSGPLPDPESLVDYDKVIPNGADRLMKMAEKQQDHRISIENSGKKSNQSKSNWPNFWFSFRDNWLRLWYFSCLLRSFYSWRHNCWYYSS